MAIARRICYGFPCLALNVTRALFIRHQHDASKYRRHTLRHTSHIIQMLKIHVFFLSFFISSTIVCRFRTLIVVLFPFVFAVHLRLLRAFGHSSNISSQMLLVITGNLLGKRRTLIFPLGSDRICTESWASKDGGETAGNEEQTELRLSVWPVRQGGDN